MNLRPHPALSLALATALAGTAAATAPAVPAVADDEEMVQHCYTLALTDEEVAAGATSEIDCYEAPASEPPVAMRGNVTFAIVYDNNDGTGDLMAVYGPSCTSGNVVFGTGNLWDNKIGSTELVACGTAKHHQWSNFTGNNQTVSTAGVLFAMNSTMNNATSSIQYAP